MTTPSGRPLSFPQRRQRRQARYASNLAFIGRPSAARDKRAAAYKADTANRRTLRQEFGREAQAAANAFRASPTLSAELREDQVEATTRALLARGLDFDWIVTNSLDQAAWDNRSLKSILRKWDAMEKKGLTRYQIETELERRLLVVQKDRMDNENHQRLLDLVREHYGTDFRGRKRHVSHLRGKAPPIRRRRRAA